MCSDEDSGNEDVLDMEYTEAEAEDLKRNAEVRNGTEMVLNCQYEHGWDIFIICV